ncbi:carbonic anhydrase-related protein 10-like [Daphnia pulicaria]|uniref:carbonic anhydrase-related protein 10-like n=1 Tax=Daphnia pulicaria TaxID=35523 RepID=UPI001EEA0FBF|nr:carbonic anhydrase-related protein 10-like [Daphnia pulicaria]
MGVVQRLLGFGGRFERRTAVTSSSLSSSSSSSSSSFYKSYMSSVLFLTALQGFWMPWILIHHQPQGASAVSWEDWWTYEGISGPAFWGLINPEWSMCNRGRRQSPINIEPSQLLFDPNLRPLHIDKNAVAGYLSNMGQGLIFTVDNSSKPSINLTGGPLSYKYEWHQMALHFGLNNQSGSEHMIAGRAFPAELQVFGFNTQLYSTYSEALESPHGIVALSVLIQIGDASLQTTEFRLLMEHITKIERPGPTKMKRGLLQPGQERPMPALSLKLLLPPTDYYITYEGSATTPACQETSTWIVFNRPLYITEQQLYVLRGLKRGSPNPNHNQIKSSSFSSPSLSVTGDPMGNNYRPIQPTHHRPVRTNIDFTSSERGEKACATMHRDMHYRANTFWQP